MSGPVTSRRPVALISPPAGSRTQAPPPVVPRPRVRRRHDWRRSLPPVAFLAPMLLTLLAVSLYPVLRTIWLAFRNTSLETQGDRFTGMSNVHRLQHDAVFWKAWRQTLEFTAVTTLAETLLGLVIALTLYKTFRGRGLIRATVLVPWAIPTVVTSRMFGWLFDGQNGVVNYLLVRLHLVSHNLNVLGSTNLALPTIVLADVWKTAPFMALLILAGLQTIPHSYTEAGRVDGASAWRIFWSIKLPMLMPSLLIAALLRALDAFRIFDLPYVLTGGGPADSTETLSTLAYKRLFSGLEIGYGSALSTAMFISEGLIAIGFALFIFRRLRAVEG